MQLSSVRVLAKYFLHGLAFSLLLFIVAMFSMFLLVILTYVGSLLGIILGLAILVILTGFANTFITEKLWFRMETSWTKYLYQGVLLLILLGIASLPVQYLYIQATRLPTVSFLLAGALLFLAESTLYGFIAKRVASIWHLTEPKPPSTSQRAPTPTHPAAPHIEPAKPIETGTTPIVQGSPEELKREEAKLDRLIKHRQKTGLLNPEVLDNLIETQKRTVETLRKAHSEENP